LVVRDEKGVLRAFRNACRRRPHALVATRTGHFSGDAIPCVPHGVSYPFDGGDLIALEIKQKSGLILVRAAGAPREGGPALTGWEAFADLAPAGVQETDIAADWKLIVEQWLEGASPPGRFLAPNQLIAGTTILRVVPVAPGRSRLQRLDYSGQKKAASARLVDAWVAQQVELAESTQTGLAAAGDDFAENGPVSAALAEFRGSIAVLLPHLGAT
jgi:hypothetical protein